MSAVPAATTVTATAATTATAPKNFKPALAFNVVKGATKTELEVWIKLGWKLFKWIEARPESKFVTSDGITIMAQTSLSPSHYNSMTKTLYFDGPEEKEFECTPSMSSKIVNWIFEAGDAMKANQTQYAQDDVSPKSNKANVLFLSKDIREGDKIELAFTKSLFGYKTDFTASNGIIIHIGRAYCTRARSDNEFSIDTDNSSMCSSNFQGFDTLMKQWDRVEVALRELDVAYTQRMTTQEPCDQDLSSWTYRGQINDPAYTWTSPAVRIEKSWYKYVKKNHDHKFKASNGIVIACKNTYTQGFENGSPDTLYFNNIVVGISWIPEIGREAFGAKRDRIQAAIKELEKVYTQFITPPTPILPPTCLTQTAPLPISATTTTTSSPVLSDQSKTLLAGFRAKLDEMDAMGFKDRKVNIDALVRTRGSIADAVELLLAHV